MKKTKKMMFVAKKIVIYLLVLTTVFSTSAGPVLASAPLITDVTVTNSSISVTFDQAVLTSQSPDSIDESGAPTNYADDLRNYVLESPDGNVIPMTRMNPFNLSTNYQPAEGENATSTVTISGLDLPNDTFNLTIDNIGNAASSTEVMESANVTHGTVSASSGPRLDSLTPMYGTDLDDAISVVFGGDDFPTATSSVEVQCYWDNNGSEFLTVQDVGATSTTVLIDGTHMGSDGTKYCQVRDTESGQASANRRFYLYNPEVSGILTGTIKDVGGATSLDEVSVAAYQGDAKWNRYEGQTQKDGKFAIAVPAGTYSIEVTTPGSGSTGAAPVKVTGKVVTAGNATNAGTITFSAADISGTVTAGEGGVPVYDAQVRAHNQNWTVEQYASTGYDGSYKLFIPPSANASQFTIEVYPGGYYKNVLGYLDASEIVNVATSTPQTVDILLNALNVTGTVKSPLDSNSVINPNPDHPVPNANVRISNNSGFERNTQTDSNGVFNFGGVPVGTYNLELNAPSCGDELGGEFCMLSRTTNTVTVDSAEGLNTLAPAGTTFKMPNFFGTVVDNQGDPVEGIFVNIGNQAFWSNATTDSEGRFAFYLPNTGTYQIQVPAPPSGLASFSAQIPVTNLINPQSYPIALSMPNVSGYVYGPLGSGDEAAGQANTWVELCPIYGGNCSGAQTNDDGAFSINVSDGTWTMSTRPNWDSFYIEPAPYTVIVGDLSVTSVVKSSIADNVADGNEPWTTNGIIMRMVDPANDTLGLLGTVYGPAGSENATTTQANIQIGIRPAIIEKGGCRGDGMSRWAQTNVQGKFAYSGVDSGVYEIEAMPMNDSEFLRTRICPVTVGDGARSLSINLTAPNIRGTVMTPLDAVGDETSNPTPDVAVQYGWVSLQQENQQGPGGGWYGGNSNDAGEFAIGGVPAGTYTLEVQAGWGGVYSSARFQHIVIDEDGNCTLGLENDGTSADGACDLNDLTGVGDGDAVRVSIPNIIGSVFDPDGANPVANVWVMVHLMDWSQNAGGNADSEGIFRIGGLADGDYQIEVNIPNGGQQSFTTPAGLSVSVASGVGIIKINGEALTDNQINLVVPGETISGTVTKGGDPVTNARVSANRDMGGGFFETKTDGNGEYELKVSGGGWWVQVMPDFTSSQPDWIYTESPKKVVFPTDGEGDVETVDFAVTASDSAVTGLVKTPDGDAIQNAWVQLQGNKGAGSGGQTDNNGRFTIRIPSGSYFVNIFSNSSNYGAPDQKSVTVASNQTADAGTLYLKDKNAHIKGFVQDDAGSPMANVIVNAKLMDGPGWAMTYTDQTGAYDLAAWAGDWMVMVMPMSQSYVYQGSPKQMVLVEDQTSNNNNFELKAANKTLKVSVRKTSGGALVTDVWGGVWIKDTSAQSMLDFGGPMSDIMEKSGMMSGDKGDGGMMAGQGMEQGGFTGGALSNGYTEINVPAGTYQVGLGMPPGSKYTLIDAVTATISDDDSSVAVDLLVSENDKTVSGQFYIDTNENGAYDAGEEVSVRGFINADNGSGGWQMTESDSSDGSYSMMVSSGEWFINAFVDSMTVFDGKSYMVVNDNEKTTVAAGGATRNFQVKELNATIYGTVKNPDGSAMNSNYGTVWVFADFGSQDMIDQFNGQGGPGLGIFTEADGTYELKVPVGTYKIGAGIPPWDTRDLLNPDLTTVIVDAEHLTSVGNNLQFKLSDATITGQITLDGDPQGGFIRAWSDSGRGSGTISADGSYELKATQDDVWHVVVASKIANDQGGDEYYESSELTVVTSGAENEDGNYENNDLELEAKGFNVPAGVSSTFDSSQLKTIKLTNGDFDEVVMDIPAGAIATSGSITVSITPTVEVKPDSNDKPIGVAYEFEARDADGNKIESFNQDVTITIAYDPAIIAAAGYSEDGITPKYYNTTTGSWENYSNVVRDPDNDKLIIKTNHFSAGGITGGDIPTAPSSLAGEAANSTQIDLTWTDNSSNETGFKIYRDDTLIDTEDADTTSYSDTDLTVSTAYEYYVRATNDAGDSLASGTVTVVTTAGGSVPTAPSGLTATASSSSRISLTWNDNSSNETGFKIYRGDTLVRTAAVNATSYTDTGLSSNTSYSYYVKATNSSGNSNASNTASATTKRSSGGSSGGSGSASVNTNTSTNVAPVNTANQEVPVTAMTREEIVAKIAQVKTLILQLQAQLLAITGTTTGAATVVEGIPAGFKFTAILKPGTASTEVLYLQAFLKAQGADIYPAGIVNGVYGPLTTEAVAKFQEKYAEEILQPFGLTNGTGIVGLKTILKINSLTSN